MVGTLFKGNVLLYTVTVVMAVAYYLYDSESHVISFTNMDGKTEIQKFSFIFNREVVRGIARILITVGGYVFAFDTLEDVSYKYFLVVIIVVLIISARLYRRVGIEGEK